MESQDFNWDEIKKKLEEAVKLERNDNDLSIKIILLVSNIQEDEMVGGMLKGEEEMKKSLGQFLNKKEPLNCEIEINEEDKSMLLKFEKKKEFKQVYELLNEMFFGDFFKKMIEALMGAFGDAFGSGEFKF